MRPEGGQLSDERPGAGGEIGRVLAGVAVPRGGMEPAAHALHREQPPGGCDDLEHVDARRAPAHGQLGRGAPVDRDAERSRDVVGAARGQQRHRRQSGNVEIRERVDRAVAADQDHSAILRPADRSGELLFVRRHERTHARSGVAERTRRPGSDLIGAGGAAGPPIDDELHLAPDEGERGTPALPRRLEGALDARRGIGSGVERHGVRP